MDQAKLLYQLQELDLRLARASAELEAQQAKIKEPPAVRQARAGARSAGERVTALGKELRSSEQEAQAVAARRAAAHERLYGGRVSSPRELAALETEEAGLARSLSQLEDRELELMAAAEEADAASLAAQRLLDQELARWRQDGQAAHEHIGRLEAELARVMAQREALAAEASPANLRAYERLRPKKANRPVALVEGATCQACGVVLPSSEVQRARGADPPKTCDNCGRLLYVP